MNWRIGVLQTPALPLGYGADKINDHNLLEIAVIVLERDTRFELATFTLAR